MTTENRPDFIRLITVCALVLVFILVIGALRAREQPFFRIGATKIDQETLPDTVKRRDELQNDRWHNGFRLLRYWWIGGAAVYVAEMDRTAEDLQFSVELTNNQILGRETVTGVTRRLMNRDVLPLAGVNGSFGIREDNRGRGGMMFNLHIQNGELVSIPILLDRWGYSPPSPWGETSFGVTPDGEFLMDAVQLNGKLRMENGASDPLSINAINQICDSVCPVVLFTPRFGRRTLTRRAYEFTLRQIKLPLTGKYKSRFVVTAVNPRGNSTIPSDGVVLAIEPHLARDWENKIRKSTAGTLEIALTPRKWQSVQHGVGGNLRLVRNGKVEPELMAFGKSRGGTAYRHRNGASRHPRSALGFNDEKLFLIAIDGRQHGYSMGMTLYDMGKFFSELGIKHAINFDGGSSSTLWALGRVANSPAHGYERRIFNVAMIRTRDKQSQ
ncbi:MAG: phosphodiester glycosidase family protein [Candidatus Poribacteria bacterium]|nr:phosphodiester glycosidase family protein [Candidatus Poribacteria bacterium]MYK18328.1 phosphodiester glycosidase family protein [Candidatus Poribacteria bacterium]